jgi:small multidrug resistance family-3 protein
MTITRSIVLFVLAALFEIGGAWLVWQGSREHCVLWFVAAGVIALGAYGFARILAEPPSR